MYEDEKACETDQKNRDIVMPAHLQDISTSVTGRSV